KPLISFGIKLPKLPKLLFIYETLKILDTSLIKNGIEKWLEHEGYINSYCYKEKLNTPKIILDSLTTMFLRRSKGLEELSINDLHMLPTTTTFLNNMSGITQLKTLRVNFRCYKDYEDIISMKRVMNKLDLKVVPSDASDALVNIMKSHKKLENLELDANRIGRSVEARYALSQANAYF
ncbi:5411_t:CDS:2, partial [Dentiscutata heterogama]